MQRLQAGSSLGCLRKRGIPCGWSRGGGVNGGSADGSATREPVAEALQDEHGEDSGLSTWSEVGSIGGLRKEVM